MVIAKQAAPKFVELSPQSLGLRVLACVKVNSRQTVLGFQGFRILLS
jgi:hypothetical protein